MSSPPYPDCFLKELKVSIDILLTTLQAQSSKHDDTIFLLQNLSGKVDLSGQRLRSVETDVKLLKGAVEKTCVQETDAKSVRETGAKTGTASVESDGDCSRAIPQEMSQAQTSHLKDLNLQQEIKDAIKENCFELKNFMKEEIDSVKEVCKTCSCAVMSKLDKAEDLVFKPMLEMASGVQQTVSVAENLDRGVRNIENSLNEYAQTLQNLGEKAVEKDELNVKLDILTDKSEQQIVKMGQLLPKDDLIERLDRLTNSTENLWQMNTTKENQQATRFAAVNCTDQGDILNHVMLKADLTQRLNELKSNVEKIGSELKLDGAVEKINNHHCAIIDQLLAEHEITREILGKTRVKRKTHKCDFYVTHVSICQGSGKSQISRIWYIDDADTYVKGDVTFDPDGMLDIWLVSGRYPRVVGLKPLQKKNILKTVVSAVKQGKRNLELGSEDVGIEELTMSTMSDGWHESWGERISKVPFEKLKTEGYVDDGDRILLRFSITTKE